MQTEMFDTFSHREKLIYLAGLFDGEGCAHICKAQSCTSKTGFSYRSVLGVEMTDSTPVKLFHDCFSGSFYIGKTKPPWKPPYTWKVCGKEAAKVAVQLLSFSCNPRKRIALECIIDFGKTFPLHPCTCCGIPPDVMQYRELLYKRCHAINATGSEANNQTPADLALIAELKPKTAQLTLWD